ncbi:MAG TPA: FHA domain-containing RING-H2 finger protein [Verrucomicrobiae bacterium]|nr:FHA domain-containing RING-H2 finger protein [Verrucomicrobiae bacterium]
MARLLVKTEGLNSQFLELKLGVNRVGRSPDNDFQISHPTISSLHCEFILNNGGITLRDLESTNGTFINGEMIRECQLTAGQTVRLGDVELYVETTDVNIGIPKFANPEIPAPPVVATDGSMICPRHAYSQVTHRCTACKEIMCEACIHRLRRRGSKRLLLLCPICSHPVEILDPSHKPKKKSLFSRIGETVKMKITRTLRFR